MIDVTEIRWEDNCWRCGKSLDEEDQPNERLFASLICGGDTFRFCPDCTERNEADDDA